MTAGGNNSALGVLSNYLSVFSGGSLSQSTIFGLGIMPYISASIIIQLLGTVVPSLEKLKKEGEPGIRKINDWTRQLTVLVCLIQSAFYVASLSSTNGEQSILTLSARGEFHTIFMLSSVAVLTAGSMFLMWLGEQIDAYGIGNGVSLIITAGIISRMPDSVIWLAQNTSIHGGGAGAGTLGPGKIAFLVCCFVFVVAGSILLTQAQRRIKITQAKHMRGRRVYGGQNQYLPLRVNHAGVMPIIFASSLMIFPVMAVNWISNHLNSTPAGPTTAPATAAAVATHSFLADAVHFLQDNFKNGAYLYEIFFCALIFFFSYFWNTVQFQPKEMADQLRDYGSFIPGLRPGKRTAEYLENVMSRITYVGAAFLCVIAVIPTIITSSMLDTSPQAFQASQFFGGTGLLIVISVMLDFVNRIEAGLVMRNYSGFLDNDKGGPGRGGSGAKNRRTSGGPVRRGPTAPQPSAARSNDGPKGLPA
jgi:preprotein translocase subunit SecY